MVGSTIPDPSSSLMALTGLVEELERSSLYSNLTLVPPSQVAVAPGSERIEQDLVFAIEGTWERPR